MPKANVLTLWIEIYTRRIGEQNERISGLEKTVVAKDLRIGELEQAVEEAKKQEKALDEFRQREGQTQAELRNQVEHMGSLKEEVSRVRAVRLPRSVFKGD